MAVTYCAGHLMKNFTKRVKALDTNLKVPKGTPKLASTHPSLMVVEAHQCT